MTQPLFDPSAELIPIVVLGRLVRVPQGETLLRQLQYLDPSVGEGRFCWSGECRECEVAFRMGSDGLVATGLGCQIRGRPGLEVVRLSPELRYRLDLGKLQDARAATDP